MAAYAALTSLLQILDQLEHHPFPPISLDREQVESLTEIATFLQEFLEGYDSPFVDSDEADPLEMRIADAAYAAEDVIESYIAFAVAATHGDEVYWEEEINSNEETASLDDEVNSSSGDEVNSEEEINSNEETASLDDEVNSSSGEETNNQKKKICRFFNCFRGSKKPKNDGKENKIQFAAAATHDDEVISSFRKELNSEKEIKSNEDASSGPGEENNCYRGSTKPKIEGKKSKNELVINLSISTSDYNNEISCVNLYQDVWKVIEEMDLVKKEAMEKTDVQAHLQLQRNILRSSSFNGKNSSTVMLGFDDVLLQLLHKLTGEPSSGLQVIPITGMGGIGKTTLARNIFQHAYVKEHFDICAWVTISQQYNTKEILSQILYQASGKLSEKSEEELGNELHKYLFGRRYLIIMDDIWSIEVWEEMRLYFPNCENGSRAVVTTRQSFLTSQLTDSNDIFHMKFLNEVNSWNLFSKTVFGEERFPLRLEKIGKKIVEKCRGLPLSIVVIGGLLAKSQKTQKYWEHIEQKLENDEFCLKILKLSYHHLPAYLKPCFLYMGIFKEDTRIRVSTLIKLWVSEGFIKPENGKSLELIGEGFVKDLIDRNLILVDVLGKTGNIKFCKMHDLLRDLCIKEAENERFYHVMGQHSHRGIQNHKRRRMVSDQSSSEERVMSSLESTRFHVRSLTYGSEFGWFEYEDVIVNSHYVAIINFSEKHRFLSSVNFRWNLHILRCNVGCELIVAPVVIWKMSQLRHVEFHCSGNMYLPDPPSGSSIVILENLQTLTGIQNFKCGEEMVKRIPNIKKLKIEYRETEGYDGDDYCLSISNLHSLHKLESLTIELFYGMYDDFLHNIIFPQSLIKLSLELNQFYNGVGCEEMLEKIGGSLPLLQKLNLRWVKFETGEWKTVEGHFPSLKYLKLCWCDGLKYWTTESSHFPCLEHLHLFGLKKLQEIPLEIGEIPTLKSIHSSYCSKLVVKSAKKIVEEQEELQGGEEHLSFLVQVEVDSDKIKALESLESRNFQIKVSHYFHVHNYLFNLISSLIDRKKVVEIMRKKIAEEFRSSFNGCDCKSWKLKKWRWGLILQK